MEEEDEGDDATTNSTLAVADSSSDIMNKNSKREKKDVWSVLMQSSKKNESRDGAANKKRRRPTPGCDVSSRGSSSKGSLFVECPAGCGKHVLESIINVHLDRCPVLHPRPAVTSTMPDRSRGDEATMEKVDALEQQTLIVDESLGGDLEPSTDSAAAEPPCPTITQCICPARRRITQDPAGSSAAASAEKRREIVHGPLQQPTPGPDYDDVAVQLPLTEDQRSVACESPASEASCKDDASTMLHEQASMVTSNSMPTAFSAETAQSALDSSSEKNLKSSPQDASCPNLDAEGAQLTTKKGTIKSGASNAFALMMERSKLLNSKWYGPSSNGAGVAPPEAHPIQQCLYLSTSDGVRVTLLDGASKPPPTLPVAWSAVVVLKDRPVDVESTSTSNSRTTTSTTRRPVELTIATDLPSADDNAASTMRYVRYHSRLSVPVLKSVLQKSIRRRRPLPSVRVAMELADKSFGDLIRRLPVIVLEDSTLHPDLDLMIWLMVAHSKDYVVPRPVMTRVFQIVFEVASCQWKDDETVLAHEAASTTSFESTNILCLNTLHSDGWTDPSPTNAHQSVNLLRSNKLIWSMLVRADYGGMRCDVDMLHRFARLWQSRFRSPGGVPAYVVERWGVDPTKSPLSWRDVPALLHERAAQQSADRVQALVAHGIPSLAFENIAVEGVDFHCSPIVDHLLSHPVAKLCSDLLVLSGTNADMNDSSNDPKISLEKFFRYCLWHYSSGVNRRRPLLQGPQPQPLDSAPTKTTPRRPDDYEEMWRQLVAKEALRYQGSFIRERLARPN